MGSVFWGHLGSFVLRGFVGCSRQRSHFKDGGVEMKGFLWK